MPERHLNTPAKRDLGAAPARPVPRPPHLDPLTQVLDGIHLQCMVPSAHEMTAPWGLRFGPMAPQEFRRHIESKGLPPPPHAAPPIHGELVAILRGSCCLEMPAQKFKLPLASGDVVLITRKEPYILRDEWRTPARQHVIELVRREDLEHQRGVRGGGGGVSTMFLSGMFSLEDEEDHPLLLALPQLIHVRGTNPDAAPWLESTLRFIASELASKLPGSQSIVNHLAHVLFVEAVRAYAASLPEGAGNWLHAIFDPELAPALGLMHSNPEQPWTVATLAEQACMSRSAFSARFAAAVGQPPLQYLTDCRMRTARALLRETGLGAKTIAAKVGYSNESAFSHAFRRACGMSPGAYRESRVVPR